MKYLFAMLLLPSTVAMAHGMGALPWWINVPLIVIMSPFIAAVYVKDTAKKIKDKIKKK